MKKNIIYICGNNSAGVEVDKTLLIKTFQEKYGKESIEFCSLDYLEKYQEYYEKIASISLFQKMRMFVFFGGKEKKGRSKKNNTGFEEICEKILPILSEKDFLLFYEIHSGEENLKKWLEKNSTQRIRNLSWNVKDWTKQYHISENSAIKILNRYKNAEKMRDKGEMQNPFLGHSIAHTMKNIAILESMNENINDDIIAFFSHEYEGAKIFDFIDAILAKNIKKALYMRKVFEKSIQTSEEMNIFLAQFLGILRKNMYILFLKNYHKSVGEISKILPGTHNFVIEKTLESKISYHELKEFFKKISHTITAYRTGKGMKETILGQFLEIDTAIFLLKK